MRISPKRRKILGWGLFSGSAFLAFDAAALSRQSVRLTKFQQTISHRAGAHVLGHPFPSRNNEIPGFLKIINDREYGLKPPSTLS